MLVVNIEIWPFGDKRDRCTISTLKIANIGPRGNRASWDGSVADYAVVLEKDGEEIWRYVKAHHRRKGAEVLVKRALKAVN